MRLDNEYYRTILDNLYDGVYFVDRDRKIIYWNKGAERITGFSAEEVLGTYCSDNVLIHVDSRGVNLCKGECPLLETMEDGKIRETEVYLHHKDGYRVPVLLHATPIKDSKGEIIGAVQIFIDNSPKLALAQRVEELRKMAFLDPLTSLANRRYIEINIKERLSELNRYGWPFGVIFTDVDKFKAFNDTYGHNVGDKVLQVVAKTLSVCSRPFDIIGRWGGDEFIAIIINVRKKHLHDIAQRFNSLIRSSSVSTEHEILRITVSIGAALAKPGDTMDSLLKRADRLMYQSKVSGGNRITMEARR